MSRGRLLVVGVGLCCAAVVALVAANHALEIQVVGAAAGAVTATGGVALASSSWRYRHATELRSVGVAFGFFLACVGTFLMVAGAGLYH